MTLALSLQWLKRILKIAWNFRAVITISIFMFFITLLQDDVKKAQQETEDVKVEFNAYKTKQTEALLKAEIEAKERENKLLVEQQQIQEKYHEDIKAMQNDVTSANRTASSLSNKLTIANEHLSKATEQQVRVYASTSTELLDFCSTRLVYYSGQAQQHRLAEQRVVDSYNNLIDSYNSDNK